MSVAAVIPCYNGSATIASVVLACRPHVGTVIVVSDGSTDHSAAAAASAGAIVHEIPHQGTGTALRCGIDMARSQNYKTIVTIDADGAHDPKDIPALLAVHFQAPERLTIGNRFTPRTAASLVPTTKLVANRFASRLASLVSGTRVADAACGFRAFRAANQIPHATVHGFGLLYEMLFDALAGSGASWCPVSVRYDANELLITKTGELLDFLRACAICARDRTLVQVIHMITSRVESGRVLRLALGPAINSPMFVIAHPVPGASGYAFQRQHQDFAHLVADDIVTL